MKKTKKSNIKKERERDVTLFFDGSTVSVCHPWTKHIHLYIFPPFGMVLVFGLGSAFAMFHWSVLPRLVISSNHMESLFCLLHNRLIQCHFLLPWSSRVMLLFKGILTRVGHSAVSLDSLFSRPSWSCQYLVLSHQMFLVLCSCWFEKVSIDFLLAVLSLIDYDTLLWEQT